MESYITLAQSFSNNRGLVLLKLRHAFEEGEITKPEYCHLLGLALEADVWEALGGECNAQRWWFQPRYRVGVIYALAHYRLYSFALMAIRWAKWEETQEWGYASLTRFGVAR